MKRLNYYLVLAFLLISFIHANAQVQQGDVNLGLNSTFQVTSFQGTSITNTTFVFSGQYYITDNISGGIAPIVSFSGFEVSGIKSKNSTLAMNLFGNYNFLLSSGDLLPYAGANLLFINSKSSTSGGGSDTDTSNGKVNFGINGGAKYFFNERINIDGNLSYSFNLSATSKVNGTEFDVNSDGGTFLFTIGLGIIISKRGN